MDLTNRTPLPAALSTTELSPELPRVGFLTAKATWRWNAAGELALDTQEPFGILDEDEPTDLGLLPRDNLPRRDEAFEVIVLGAAYPQGGRPATWCPVGMSVGSVRRELLVIGDREWLPLDAPTTQRSISDPAPFTRMPLTWERSFGGTATVLLDPDAEVVVNHAMNPLGTGFDPAPAARILGRQVGVPEGWPRVDRRRRLPNIERPDDRVANWASDPRPGGWATIPLDSPMHGHRLADAGALARDPEPSWPHHEALYRAHPDWILPLPPAGTPVVLDGFAPEGRITLTIPRLRAVMDWVIGDERGSLELRPHTLVLLPEERRLYMVYRTHFNLPQPGVERALRLRTEEGWFGASAP